MFWVIGSNNQGQVAVIDDTDGAVTYMNMNLAYDYMTLRGGEVKGLTDRPKGYPTVEMTMQIPISKKEYLSDASIKMAISNIQKARQQAQAPQSTSVVPTQAKSTGVSKHTSPRTTALSSQSTGMQISPTKLGNAIMNETADMLYNATNGADWQTLEDIARANSVYRKFSQEKKVIQSQTSNPADQILRARECLSKELVNKGNKEAAEEIDAVTMTGVVTKLSYHTFDTTCSINKLDVKALQELLDAMYSGVVLFTVLKSKGAPTTFAGSINRNLLDQYYGNPNVITMLELNQAIHGYYLDTRAGNYKMGYKQPKDITLTQYPDGNPNLKMWSAAIRVRNPKTLKRSGQVVTDASSCEYSVNLFRTIGAWSVNDLDSKGEPFSEAIANGQNINLDPDLVKLVYSGNISDVALEGYVKSKAFGASQSDIQAMTEALIKARDIDASFKRTGISLTKDNLIFLKSVGITNIHGLNHPLY